MRFSGHTRKRSYVGAGIRLLCTENRRVDSREMNRGARSGRRERSRGAGASRRKRSPPPAPLPTCLPL
eukprot:4448310-Pyramimonas_sp.AAC.1